MSLAWRRRLPLSPPPGGERDEVWEVSEDGAPEAAVINGVAYHRCPG